MIVTQTATTAVKRRTVRSPWRPSARAWCEEKVVMTLMAEVDSLSRTAGACAGVAADS